MYIHIQIYMHIYIYTYKYTSYDQRVRPGPPRTSEDSRFERGLPLRIPESFNHCAFQMKLFKKRLNISGNENLRKIIKHFYLF